MTEKVFSLSSKTLGSKSLDPSRIMDAGARFWLGTQLRVIMPAVVKKNKDGLDPMLIGCCQKLINALLESLGILMPYQIVEVDSHGIQPKIGSPAKFAIDAFQVKTLLLPHLQLVDGSTGNEVASPGPSLFLVPFICFFNLILPVTWNSTNRSTSRATIPCHNLKRRRAFFFCLSILIPCYLS